MAYNLVPSIDSESSLAKYLQEIQRFPILSETEEVSLAMRWRDYADLEAAHQLVTSHLRLVAKIAMRYRGYGLPMTDIISEGNIGLMHAVKKFTPELGHRLSTYSMWWIKAYIQDYILKSWSLVKIGTSSVQKRLFFNLRRLKNKLLNLHGNGDIYHNAEEIARQLNVKKQDVLDMDGRMLSNENSLNDINNDGEERMDSLADPALSNEFTILESNDYAYKKAKMDKAISALNAREQEIIDSRMLQEPPSTLEELSNKFGISRERIRQIEAKAMYKLQQYCAGA